LRSINSFMVTCRRRSASLVRPKPSVSREADASLKTGSMPRTAGSMNGESPNGHLTPVPSRYLLHALRDGPFRLYRAGIRRHRRRDLHRNGYFARTTPAFSDLLGAISI
jgi:hypothetical protein